MFESLFDLDEETEYEFENGEWIWDDDSKGLQFVKNQKEIKPIDDGDIFEPSTGFIVIDEEINGFEQLRFLRRFRRECDEEKSDIVILQDIKDVVLYTVPHKIQSEAIINILHTKSFDRYIRSLIVYMRYFLELKHVMKTRIKITEFKIRTDNSERIETKWSKNLSELRAVVGKEYFHVFFEEKRQQKTDTLGENALFTEVFIRFSVQIVWICLGRNEMKTIESEINRLFRSEHFNHSRIDSKTYPVYSPIEKKVLHGGHFFEKKENLKIFGSNRSKKNMFKTTSPAVEAMLKFDGDFRVLGMFLYGFDRKDSKMSRLEDLFCAPEEELRDLGIELGILGLSRERFDPLLKPIKLARSAKSAMTTARNTPKSVVSVPSVGSIRLTFNYPESYPNDEVPLELPKLPPTYQERPPFKSQKIKWIRKFRVLEYKKRLAPEKYVGNNEQRESIRRLTI